MRVFLAHDCVYVQVNDYELVLNVRGRYARIDGPKTMGTGVIFRRRWLWGYK